MKTIYYHDFSDNFVETKNQAKTIPENYRFISKNPLKIFAGIILFGVFKILAIIYSKTALKLKVVGKDKLKNYVKTTKKGYFIYANHTLTYGDVFNPVLYNPVHPYYICDSSNLGIPILGPLLPLVSALPIPESIRGKKHLFDAISHRAEQGKAIVIYPEAHLWPYYTSIRPFDTTAFAFPIRNNLPIFTATTTFHKRRLSSKKRNQKPRVVIYIDGPFYADEALGKHEKNQFLHDKAYDILLKRSQLSNVEYINYQKRED